MNVALSADSLAATMLAGCTAGLDLKGASAGQCTCGESGAAALCRAWQCWLCTHVSDVLVARVICSECQLFKQDELAAICRTHGCCPLMPGVRPPSPVWQVPAASLQSLLHNCCVGLLVATHLALLSLRCRSFEDIVRDQRPGTLMLRERPAGQGAPIWLTREQAFSLAHRWAGMSRV